MKYNYCTIHDTLLFNNPIVIKIYNGHSYSKKKKCVIHSDYGWMTICCAACRKIFQQAKITKKADLLWNQLKVVGLWDYKTIFKMVLVGEKIY